MLVGKVAVLFLVQVVLGQVTRRENRLLSRQKRYLAFPAGSNFVVTLSGVKAVMIQVPRGINVLGECDVPFSLPSDTRLFRKHRRPHTRQRREIFRQLSIALEGYGFDGDSCIKKMICEVRAYVPLKGKSLVHDLLSAVFKEEAEDELGHEYLSYCNDTTFAKCDVPLLNFITQGP